MAAFFFTWFMNGCYHGCFYLSSFWSINVTCIMFELSWLSTTLKIVLCFKYIFLHIQCTVLLFHVLSFQPSPFLGIICFRFWNDWQLWCHYLNCKWLIRTIRNLSKARLPKWGRKHQPMSLFHENEHETSKNASHSIENATSKKGNSCTLGQSREELALIAFVMDWESEGRWDTKAQDLRQCTSWLMVRDLQVQDAIL